MTRTVIHIYGASGSGTTTLGRLLAQRLGFFHLDTDDYFWLPTDPPFTTPAPLEVRQERLMGDLLAHEGVVVSGTLGGWAQGVMPYCTLGVRLYIDSALRMERLKAREYARFGERIRPGGDMAEEHQAFLEFAAQYDTGGTEVRSRVQQDLLEQELPCPILRLDSSAPVLDNLEAVCAALQAMDRK